MTTIANHGGRLLRLPQVCDITGVKRSMIYQMEAEQRFPRRIKIGARAVVWLEEETRWMATGDGDGAYAAYPCDGLAHSLRELLRGMPFWNDTRRRGTNKRSVTHQDRISAQTVASALKASLGIPAHCLASPTSSLPNRGHAVPKSALPQKSSASCGQYLMCSEVNIPGSVPAADWIAWSIKCSRVGPCMHT
jgi:prophage regulatory protein